MKGKNKFKYNLCFKYTLCKQCPRNEKCTNELKDDAKIFSTNREKIHIDLSNYFKEKNGGEAMRKGKQKKPPKYLEERDKAKEKVLRRKGLI